MSLIDDTCDKCGGTFDPMGDPLLTKHPEIGPYAVFCATCATPAHPPAAPETDVNALREWAARFLVQCGPCDAGLPMRCACTTEDERPLIAALLDALEAARERVRVVEGERDAARAERDKVKAIRNDTCRRALWCRGAMALNARAESAEAAHAALVAAVEALADKWERPGPKVQGTPEDAAAVLRALLAGGAR